MNFLLMHTQLMGASPLGRTGQAVTAPVVTPLRSDSVPAQILTRGG